MGDRFQTVVDLEATATDAEELSTRALNWLISEQIVSAERTDCVLGAPYGNPPGPQWAKAVTEPGWKPTDGLKIKTGQTVFFGGQGGAEYAECPRCTGQIRLHTEDWDEIEGALDPFYDAINLWHETGEATVACPHCAQTPDLRSWRWADDYFAFGYLGFEFWNWPEFDPRFIADLGRVLNGHKLVRVWGKL